MTNRILPYLLSILLFFSTLLSPVAVFAMSKGIYISQTTLEDTPQIKYLIKRSKAVGIDTFVIDLEKLDPKYAQNIQLVLESGLKYVARIIMFHHGGTDQQVASEDVWQKKFILVQQAVNLGAREIQLDYIRYSSDKGRTASSEHAKNIRKIIAWYKTKLKAMNIPLQVDVFGITSLGEEKHIGQSIPLFSDTLDTLCPMVYPSHFEPFRQHAVTPYKTVYGALMMIRGQFNGDELPFKLFPYIELSNYRYPLSREERYAYIRAQLKAAVDANADGWYAWSPSNRYDNLFTVLEKNLDQKLANN